MRGSGGTFTNHTEASVQTDTPPEEDAGRKAINRAHLLIRAAAKGTSWEFGTPRRVGAVAVWGEGFVTAVDVGGELAIDPFTMQWVPTWEEGGFSVRSIAELPKLRMHREERRAPLIPQFALQEAMVLEKNAPILLLSPAKVHIGTPDGQTLAGTELKGKYSATVFQHGGDIFAELRVSNQSLPNNSKIYINRLQDGDAAWARVDKLFENQKGLAPVNAPAYALGVDEDEGNSGEENFCDYPNAEAVNLRQEPVEDTLFVGEVAPRVAADSDAKFYVTLDYKKYMLQAGRELEDDGNNNNNTTEQHAQTYNNASAKDSVALTQSQLDQVQRVNPRPQVAASPQPEAVRRYVEDKLENFEDQFDRKKTHFPKGIRLLNTIFPPVFQRKLGEKQTKNTYSELTLYARCWASIASSNETMVIKLDKYYSLDVYGASATKILKAKPNLPKPTLWPFLSQNVVAEDDSTLQWLKLPWITTLHGCTFEWKFTTIPPLFIGDSKDVAPEAYIQTDNTTASNAFLNLLVDTTSENCEVAVTQADENFLKRRVDKKLTVEAYIRQVCEDMDAADDILDHEDALKWLFNFALGSSATATKLAFWRTTEAFVPTQSFLKTSKVPSLLYNFLRNTGHQFDDEG